MIKTKIGTRVVSTADHQQGHRSRLRERFLNGGASAINDYELMEMILFAANPRGDVKPLAKDLIKTFGSFSAVFQASSHDLLKVKTLGKAGAAMLKAVQLASQMLVKENFKSRPLLFSGQEVIDYCKVTMAHLQIEQLRLLYLDRQHQLIAEEVQQQGTIDHTPVYIREVIKRALELGAAGLIVVHNHPSGDPTPSRADIQVTRDMQDAAATLGIIVHDHIIIGQNRHTSFRTQGLI
jgi:DNA repair protein RadC